MRKILRSITILTVLFLIVGTFSACFNTPTGDSDKLKVALVCSSAGKNDNGYNQSAVKGLEKLAEELDYEYKVIETTNGIPSALEILSNDGYNVIFSLEYDFDALIKGVAGSKPIAELYPEITFVVFNDNPNIDEKGQPIHKNVISVLFDVNEASYIAGALSVQLIENYEILFGQNYKFTPLDKNGRSIGFIGGTNSNGITVFANGFIQGINHAAKDLDVNYEFYSKYDAGFSDPALGNTIAGTFYNQGANVVFSVAGSVGDGAASKAKEYGKLAIHVDADKDTQQPGNILTSVMKNTEVPVKEIVKSVSEGSIKGMDNFRTFSLKSGATSITDLSEISKYINKDDSAQKKWNEIKQYLKEIEKDIFEGNIKVTNAAIGEKFDYASCENVIIK